MKNERANWKRSVRIPAGDAVLDGELIIPPVAHGVVLFAHGSGSSRHSPRNQYVAEIIRMAGIATLLFDLLTAEEEGVDVHTRHLRFDIELLAKRLVNASAWMAEADSLIADQINYQHLRVGFFGASTGGGAALVAAATLGERVGAVVSRGGRPDLAGAALEGVKAPTLLIVGGEDAPVIELNEAAYAQLRCKKELLVIPGATHLFEEPGTLEQVALRASLWFSEHLQAESRAQTR
jgi:putative phosphoribosyl transferase